MDKAIENTATANMTDDDVQYMSNRKRMKTVRAICLAVVYTILTLWAILAIFPVVWTALNSFRSRGDILDNPFGFPLKPVFSGYDKVMDSRTNVWTGYMNSLIICLFSVLGTVSIAVLAAFVMARYQFKGRRILYGLVIACMMFPAFSLLFPIVRILADMKIYGQLAGVILPQIALNLGFTIILLRGFFQGLPIEVEESAFLDGASVPRVLFTIMLPMAQSALVTCVIFIFVWSYNDLYLPLMLLEKARRFPISLILNEIATSQALGYEYDKMAAAATLVCLPTIVVYIFLQKHIIKGLTAGAVKG